MKSGIQSGCPERVLKGARRPASHPWSARPHGAEPRACSNSDPDLKPDAHAHASTTPTLNPQTPESPVFQKYTLSGVDFNALGDNQVPISLSEFVSRYQVLNVWVTNASATIVTATAGLFTAAYAQGFAIAPSQILAITNNTADNIGNAQPMELANQRTIVFSDMTLYFNVSTVEGAAAKADVHITI